jgi:flagellar biosynthesis/type III secretory pathway protein FliH
MAETFVCLATILRGGASAPVATSAAEIAPVAEPVRVARPARSATDDALADLLAELARARVAALEALETLVGATLERIAGDVLARELALTPPALDALVARGLAAFRDEQPVAIVVGPDAVVRAGDVPVRVDLELGPGDVVIQVRHGAFESPLSFRLSEAISAAVKAADGRA